MPNLPIWAFVNGQLETLDPTAVVAGVFRRRGGLHVADRQDKATTKCQLDKKKRFNSRYFFDNAFMNCPN